MEPYTAQNSQAPNTQYPMNPNSAYGQSQYDPYKQNHQDAGGAYMPGHQQYYAPQKGGQPVQEMSGVQRQPQELHSQPAGVQYNELPATEMRGGAGGQPGSPLGDGARR